jgi:hypothetical protein
MSYLIQGNTENLAAKLTSRGRQKISEGNFVVSYFQIGDSEFDYNFSDLNGSSIIIPGQKVFVPMDKDALVKYPYKLSESEITGTTYGQPIQSSEIFTIENNVGSAGFVSEWIEYVSSPLTGSTITCTTCEININSLNGSNSIQIPTDVTFNDSEYITIYFNQLVGSNGIITTNSSSLVYKIVSLTTGVTYNILTVDRNTPNLSTYTGTITLIGNYCDPNYVDPETSINCIPVPIDSEGQQDPWLLNNVWTTKPAGLISPLVDENLTGYTSNIYASTKEFFGYTTSSGQITNTGTTITNDCGDIIIVEPEEQHSLSIVHYEGVGDYIDPDKYFKYDDYISHTTEGVEYFEVYIPFIQYHRNTGTTIGAIFHMGDTDYYINSAAIDVKPDKLKYRYLLDEQNNKVGKVFVNHQVIIFDDQEIIAALDYKTNRRYTLPIPKVSLLPIGSNCLPGEITQGLLNETGYTVYISYLFEKTGSTAMNGMHCNYYPKVVSSEIESDISIKFCSDGFNFMKNTLNRRTAFTRSLESY